MNETLNLNEIFTPEKLKEFQSKLQAELPKIQAQVETMAKEVKPITSEPRVRVLADSLSPTGKRLTTLECIFWRPILPELNTHRVFSRNTRSSRAVPVDNLIAEIKKSPWGPCEWGVNQRGMVAKELITDKSQLDLCKYTWYHSAILASQMAKALADIGVHKQVVNRLLEPYICAYTVLSSTEWDNFFNLRLANDAQPEMRVLAQKIEEAMNASNPEQLTESDWHLPYITKEEKEIFSKIDCCKMSAARCARVSYKCFDGSVSPEEDLKLYQKLVENKHFSALEHVATPAVDSYIQSNFRGWNQLRKFEDYL